MLFVQDTAAIGAGLDPPCALPWSKLPPVLRAAPGTLQARESLRKTRYRNPFQEHSAKNRCLWCGIPGIAVRLCRGTGRRQINSCP